jgi:1-acyl-sn-glycerol-3-phosphate acyltransferase
MIYPKKNFIIHSAFHWYVQFIAKNFKEIIFNSIEANPNKSILLIANHTGFWDGFLLYRVKCKLFKKRFHIMLLEKTSKRIPILKYGGAFSINKKSKDIIESLDYAAQLLKDPGNLVLIFPQGKLYSNFITEVEFEKGIIKVMKQAAGNFQLILATSFIEHFENKKPSAYIYLKAANPNGLNKIDDLQQAYQQHYNYAHQQQTQITK